MLIRIHATSTTLIMVIIMNHDDCAYDGNDDRYDDGDDNGGAYHFDECDDGYDHD